MLSYQLTTFMLLAFVSLFLIFALFENAPTNNDFSHMAPPHQMAMVTCPEWISGKGNFIDCMHGGSISDDVINTYCYIQVGI